MTPTKILTGLDTQIHSACEGQSKRLRHVAATTCALFPIGIQWEQQWESSHICIENFLTSLFRHSISRYLDLHHVTLFSDRGYWMPTLVYWLLSCGAFVVGNLIRALCWPITFLPGEKENDLRTFLNPKGAPSLYLTRLENAKTRTNDLPLEPSEVELTIFHLPYL
jgi:hypothetical protein